MHIARIKAAGTRYWCIKGNAMTATTTHSSVFARVRPWWLWIATALAFPPAGYIAHEIVGRVDDVGAAVLSGLITGAVIGTGQWVVLRRRGGSPRWIVATAAGLGIGLAAGAALVDYETSLGALMAMGAVSGVGVGLAQSASFAPLRRHALTWTLATGALWAIGWAVTTGSGIDVDKQWPVFGISGALVAAVLQCLFISRYVPDTKSTRIATKSG
jgi:hypothetical protein